jgi:hypothetical protein
MPPFMVPEDDPEIGGLRRGHRPVLFDILGPDRTTSMLPGGLLMVLHVNPSSMQFSYAKATQRTQTRGGFVEYHWGDAAEEITFDGATGGFMRMYGGLSNITAFGAGDQSRRETIAYDKYLDLLALFHNNGAIYDLLGNIAIQGYIKMIFDGGVHIGWFDGAFTVTEDANVPYMFRMSARFIIDREIMRFRSSNILNAGNATSITQPIATATLTEELDLTNILQAHGELGVTSTAILDPAIPVGNLETGPSPIGLAGRDNFSDFDGFSDL